MAANDRSSTIVEDLKADNLGYPRFGLARSNDHVTEWKRNIYLEIH